MRWTNEDRWTDIIRRMAERTNVPYPLVQSVIATESQFKPEVWRGEPAIGDASRGLMQILYKTARSVGYAGGIGDPARLTGLFDPATNIEFGTQYLAQMYHMAGDNPAGAASAYNGGWRPNLGFGKVATKAMRICQARDQKTGDCIKWRDVKAGEYSNQPYVDAVLSNLEYFDKKRQAASPVGAVTSPVTETGSTNPKTVAVLASLLLGLVTLRWRQKRR